MRMKRCHFFNMNKRIVLPFILFACLVLILIVLTAYRKPPVPEVIATVKVEQSPYRITIDTTTGIAYLLQTNTIAVIPGTFLNGVIPITQNAGVSGPIVVQPETSSIYFFDSRPHSTYYRVKPDRTLETVYAPDFWFDNAIIHPRTGYIYVKNLWDRQENDENIGGSVLVITDTQTVARIPVGRKPSARAVDPHSGLVYVGDSPGTAGDYTRMLTVISGAQVIATSDLGRPPGTNGGTVNPIIIDETGQVFVGLSQRLYALQDLKATDFIFFDKPALQILYNPVNKRIYAMMIGNEVLVLNKKLNVVKRIVIPYSSKEVGNRSMAIDPVRGYVYVGNIGDGTPAVIHDTRIIATLPVGWYTTDIGIDPNSGTVYAVNNMSHDVTVIGFPEPN